MKENSAESSKAIALWMELCLLMEMVKNVDGIARRRQCHIWTMLHLSQEKQQAVASDNADWIESLLFGA